jgi:hypothetical protein
MTLSIIARQPTEAQVYSRTDTFMWYSNKIFTFHEVNTCVALPNAFPTVIIKMMDHNVELLKKPLTVRELYTT